MEIKIPKIVIKDISELKAYENNPRNNDEAVEAVANSIREFGFKIPIVIDKENVIVCGHTRVKACHKLGITKVPCIIADDLSEDQIKAFRLADNQVSSIATWIDSKLQEELDNIEMDMEQFGFDLEFEDEPEQDEIKDELPENPYSQKGDVFLLNGHRLLCGDSTKKENFDVLLEGKEADLLFTDPPYNVDYEGQDGMKIQNDKMDSESFLSFLKSAFVNAFNSCKPGCPFYIFHSDVEELNFLLAIKEAGFKFSQIICWVKDSFPLGRKDYHAQVEPIAYGWKEGAAHYFTKDRTQTTRWDFDKPKHNDLHPTMKPVELICKAIENSSRKGEIVLDPFGGSGSTMMAAEQLKRKAYLIELDEKYVDVIVKRYLKLVQSYDNCFLLRDGKKTPLSEIKDYAVLEDDNFLN